MITLGSTQRPKLNYIVIVTPACAADTEAEVLVACGTPECDFPLLVGNDSICGGPVFLLILVVLGTKNDTELVAGGGQGTFRVVLSHIMCKKCATAGVTAGPFFVVVDCCSVITEELQAELIYKHVEGGKVVASTRLASVGIHDDVGIVHVPDEELHEEPAWPSVVASHLFQVCNLVILVHGSHVPATRAKLEYPGAERSCKIV